MLVTCGRLILCKPVQPEKVLAPIEVMAFIVVIVPDADGYAIRTVPFCTSALPFSITLKAPDPLKVKEVSDVQPVKGFS